MIFKAFSYNILTKCQKKTSHENVFKIVDRNIVSVCEKIAELAEKHLSKTFDEKVFLALSLHVQTTLQRLQAGKQIHHPQLNQIRTKYKEAFFRSYAMHSTTGRRITNNNAYR